MTEETGGRRHGRGNRFGLVLGAVLALALAAPLAVAGGATATPGVASTATTVAAAGPRKVTEDKRPNIVVVMADDMRADDLRFAPNIRRILGQGGVTFENAFSPFPLCCPARASFLTGVYAHNHGVYWHGAPYGYGSFDDSRTIATSLSEAGYRTGFIGKYLNGYGKDASKVTGEPSYLYVPNGWTDWRASFTNPGVPGIHGGTYNYFDSPYNVNGKVDNRYKGQYQTDVLGTFSVRMARRFAASPNPFFMFVSYVAPHHGTPFEHDDPRQRTDVDGTYDGYSTPARPRWVKGMFDKVVKRGAGIAPGSRSGELDVSDKPSFFRARKDFTAGQLAALAEVTRQRAEAIYVVDQQVARLVKVLTKKGEWDDTVLVFTSDNGYFLGEHRQPSGKVRAHEPSLRVPFLVTGPGMRSGQKRYDPISTVDVTATILDIANAAPPLTPDGTSRLRTIRRGDQGWTAPVVTEAVYTVGGQRVAPGFVDGDARDSVGLRTPRYSFTLYDNGEGELYDLRTDPAQMENRFGDPAYAAVQEQLTETWWQYKDCVGAECRTAMDPALRQSVQQTKRTTRGYWAAVSKLYGR
ncbi:sulfatase [Nocardioides caldifontis]|uniref:sulfatase family protein n=1 Tax=Nocardioides caldifontis TaxID=2588938 RepID=UPI0011DF3B69|nr:sulfatase [Nocardioides caldifontis]